MRSAAGSSRRPSGTAAGPVTRSVTRSTASAACYTANSRRRRDRLGPAAWARLRAGLIAGDPNGEVTLAWTVAQDLMALYSSPVAPIRAAVPRR